MVGSSIAADCQIDFPSISEGHALQIWQDDDIKPQALGLMDGHHKHCTLSGKLVDFIAIDKPQKLVYVVAATDVELSGGINQVRETLSTETIQLVRSIQHSPPMAEESLEPGRLYFSQERQR